MQQTAAPATSRSDGSGSRRRQTPPPPLPPPPPPQERPQETGQRCSVKDRLGFTPAPGDAREIILYKQPTTFGTHHSKSRHERTRTRDTESFTSMYSTGRTKFSHTTVLHRSQDFIQTRRHVSERLEDIPPRNFDVEHHDDNKTHRDREKSINGPRQTTTDLRDKLRHRDDEKTLAKGPREGTPSEQKRMRTANRRAQDSKDN
ncbi:hypothetical protein RHMOL_Rhmol06G0118500 [Rhododendron molle]|uniref:Uncharacterized protein n=1 Tax=Rhododendron molle TaxID=49168 RepID=A0ACC0NDL3_RHOML|nr:hypothetical protein RHMOL_Rhmol06G0118500 [Rhododendron molle]